MINTIYSVECNCSNPINPNGNIVKQLMVRRKLEEYDIIEHRDKSIQFRSNESAIEFVEWVESTKFPEYASNTIFPNHQDMIRDKGTLDAVVYFDMPKNRSIDISRSNITDTVYMFWKHVTSIITGKMYVLNFDTNQVIAFDKVSDIPTFQSIITDYTDDTFPFNESSFRYITTQASQTFITGAASTVANLHSPTMCIDLDNTVFTKNGKTVEVETK